MPESSALVFVEGKTCVIIIVLNNVVVVEGKMNDFEKNRKKKVQLQR